jgi:hypothetical protein
VDEGADKVIIEEFAWERLDHTAADFRYDNRALLVATGLLDAELPSGDLLDTWVAGHDFLHQGAAMLTALSRVGSDMTTVATAMLWRWPTAAAVPGPNRPPAPPTRSALPRNAASPPAHSRQSVSSQLSAGEPAVVRGQQSPCRNPYQ